MQSITESQVAACLDVLGPAGLRSALCAAFLDLGAGRAAVLPRSRAALSEGATGLMVSAMGAVLPALGVLGTKVYATRNGQFQFLVNLFDCASGLPLATLEANELTRRRTAATTALAVDALARPGMRSLALFGAGVQAQAHLEALLPLRRFETLLICARSGAAALAQQWRQRGIDAHAVGPDEAATAELLLTCTRASEPLFDGRRVREDALVAAVGSSKPAARELDDTLLARAERLVVEWKPAALQEAGEFQRAAPGVVRAERLHELGSLLEQPAPAPGITVYKSVGIGLEDVAIAQAVLQVLPAQAGA